MTKLMMIVFRVAQSPDIQCIWSRIKAGCEDKGGEKMKERKPKLSQPEEREEKRMRRQTEGACKTDALLKVNQR